MKRITGFVMGVLLVTGIWYGLGGFRDISVTKAESEVKDRVEQAVEIVKNTVKQPEGIKNQDQTESRTKAEKKVEQGGKVSVEKSSEKEKGKTSAAADLQKPSLLRANTGPGPEKREKAPEKSPVADASDKETVAQGLQVSTRQEKSGDSVSSARQFFWKPFQLESRAKGFAGHIKEKSGVACEFEKKKPGTYHVYFYYTDEGDRQEKIKRIEGTGINLQMDGYNTRRMRNDTNGEM